MPWYCFTVNGGETVDKEFPMGHAPKRVRVNGQWAYRDIVAEHKGEVVERHSGAQWPKPPETSNALGVHPKQCKEAYDHSVSVGVPTQFDKKTGNPVFESKGHYYRYRKALKHHDRDGYTD